MSRPIRKFLPAASLAACAALAWYAIGPPGTGAAAHAVPPLGALLAAAAVALAAAEMWRARRLDLALRAERERFGRVIDAAQSGILDVPIAYTGSDDGYYSGRAKEILGFAADTDTRRWPSIIELAYPEDRAPVRERLIALLKHDQRFDYDFRVARPGGGYTWVNAVGVCTRDRNGRATRFVGALLDITERKLHAQALSDQVKLTRDLIDHSPIPIYLKDTECRYVDVNQAFVRHSGRPAEQTLGRTAPEVVPAERARVYDEQDRELLARGEGSSTIEAEIPRASGTHHYLMNKTVLKRADGSVRGLLGTITDITVLKRTEQVVRENEERMRLWLENIPIPIAIYDPEGRVQYLNPAFAATFGWRLEEVRGERMPFVPEHRVAELAGVLQNLRTVGRDAFETERLTRDGRLLDVYISTGMARDRDGSPRATMVSLMDVTVRKRMERELSASREEAVQAAQAKAAFLATMSHEIRTPLNGVLGMAGLLRDTRLDPEQREYVETIAVSGDALLSVINDILDYSKIESGRMDLEQEPVEIVRLVEDSVEILAERARTSGLELACEVEDGVPAWVFGDFARLRQVLVNLVGNAVKFTAAGEVVLSVRRAAGNGGSRAMLEFRVADTGIGIARDRLPGLFRAFTQGDASTTRRFGGTGLGLAIVKRLVEAMGGEVRAESEPGRGSTFSFLIPERPARAVAAAAEVPLDISGRHILIVDDNATNLRILSRQLQRWGATTVAASGAGEALARLQDGRFDAAVLDYQMPGTDGIALARAMRANAAGAALPLVLLSSSMYRRADEAEKGLFAAQLLKPARQHHLRSAIAAAISGASFDPFRTRPDREERDRLAERMPLAILVADDVEVNRRLALLMLRGLGYEADAVATGAQAVEAGIGGRYDLILMDVQMPDMDGLEATRRIVAQLDTRRPRIVAMTAHAMASDRDRCLAAGMDGYLAKPFTPQALRAVIERTGARGGARRAAAQAAPGDAGGPIDWSRLESFAPFDADGSMVRSVVDAFAEDAPRYFSELRHAWERSDRERAFAAAHALKGAAANVGARVLELACREVESLARDGLPPAIGDRLASSGQILEAALGALRDRFPAA